jgi:hypothetical protein
MVLASAASLMTCLNFVLGVGISFSGANPGMALLGGVMWALTPFFVAAAFARFGKWRTWHSFFKIAGMLSLLPILFVVFVAKVPPEVGEIWPEGWELPLDAIELRPEYQEMPPDTAELPVDVSELQPE